MKKFGVPLAPHAPPRAVSESRRGGVSLFIIFLTDFLQKRVTSTRNNKFHTIVGPVSQLLDETGPQNLTQIKGSLACVVELRSDVIFGMTVWVMDKQHGWTKLYNLVPLEMAIKKHAIFCKGKNGVQFLGGKPGQLLTLYDHHGKLLCEFQILLRDLLDSFLVHEPAGGESLTLFFLSSLPCPTSLE
ncbi:hypothetical protein TSUD_405890 [Trifolium subterraneum]|uniref:Uncharacterized protein n=1 Tax=Trifolium subterraneum TaxID=3900 RepID=A0A2Z6PP00_TRISU|nr:hypothetical protein TSUD_405890 [Trifolium subterraneum]